MKTFTDQELQEIRNAVEKFPITIDDIPVLALGGIPDTHVAEEAEITASEVYAIVMVICKKFRELIENKGVNKYLYSNGKLRKESELQLLFHIVADCYCDACM